MKRGTKVKRPWSVPILVAAFLCQLIAGCGRVVDPEERVVHLDAGGESRYLLSVRLDNAPAIYGPVDVAFVFDGTSSMQNIIKEVTQAADRITGTIGASSVSARFAVMAFWDYGGTHPVYRTYQDMTSDHAAVAASLGRVEENGGGDWPEAYARGLYESLYLSWRSEAQRYLVLFGDAPAHDPTFYGQDLGVDPGRDGRPGTNDDLRLREVADRLQQRGIKVIALYDKGGWLKKKAFHDETLKGFRFLAAQTGGEVRSVARAEDASDMILSAIRAVAMKQVMVAPTGAYAPWVIARSLPRDGSTRAAFDIEIRVPEKTSPGRYEIPLAVRTGGDGKWSEIAQSRLEIVVAAPGSLWRVLWLLVLWGLSALLLWKLGRAATRCRMRVGWPLLGLAVRLVLFAALLGLPALIWVSWG